MIRPLQGERLLTHLNDDAIVPISRRALAPVFSLCNLPSFQGSALERTAFEAPPRVCYRVVNSGGRSLRCIAFPGGAWERVYGRRTGWSDRLVRLRLTVKRGCDSTDCDWVFA